MHEQFGKRCTLTSINDETLAQKVELLCVDVLQERLEADLLDGLRRLDGVRG